MEYLVFLSIYFKLKLNFVSTTFLTFKLEKFSMFDLLSNLSNLNALALKRFSQLSFIETTTNNRRKSLRTPKTLEPLKKD